MKDFVNMRKKVYVKNTECYNNIEMRRNDKGDF